MFIQKSGLLFVVLVILLVAQAVYFYSEINNLKSQISSKDAKISEINGRFDETTEVLGAFYQEYKELGGATGTVLLDTVEKLESAIEVYDENVEVYNAQIQNLDKRVNSIEAYLSN